MNTNQLFELYIHLGRTVFREYLLYFFLTSTAVFKNSSDENDVYVQDCDTVNDGNVNVEDTHHNTIDKRAQNFTVESIADNLNENKIANKIG